MAKHQKIKGRLLRSDKGWSHLKIKQKEWISTQLRERYVGFMIENKKVPSKTEIEAIFEEVIELIDERGIWIPSYEVKAHFNKKKRIWQNKTLKINDKTVSQ